MSRKIKIYVLLFIIGAFFFNPSNVKAESFLYSFSISSDTIELDSAAQMNILTDINIDTEYTYITHQIILSDAQGKLTFENNIPKNILTNIDLSYKDSNSSWNKIVVTPDDSSTTTKFTVDAEGKKGLSDYQFNVIYVIRTQSIFNLTPNILNSFDYLINSKMGPDDLATIKITLPSGYKPFDSTGWRLQGGRFFYSTVISGLEKNFYSVFYQEENYGGSIDALRNEITKLTQENAKLTENIIEMQRAVESYRVKNEELNWDIKDLKDELIKSKEEQQKANMNTASFRYLSWGLTLSLPGMQFFLNELREKNKISPTQLHLGSVVGTFIVFMVLYVTLFL
ncbi:MAG: hypothetical protein APG12_01489 [Candidatus Methanofastidiosum methylothiophilum]|uniref:Uncharacterized protein n=1 Tax=Candidatus Methanofastidiosum methylothiophilum TaxID=1705564 RepID=A0A150IWN2_9EURY|nr:MAG: hypothetical protein APG10_01241 [Candidatus Methanofastidiosum methylthiophilus]KYC47773.1 MAG: hypothetical protein APG11_00851 [Candidatus Methanofastidiosum methylthiophilus]KYC49401.1 MAG: hypothetical protein APG12_01489 [Candidatus Methanofastidiosum methylthiophilus]